MHKYEIGGRYIIEGTLIGFGGQHDQFPSFKSNKGTIFTVELQDEVIRLSDDNGKSLITRIEEANSQSLKELIEKHTLILKELKESCKHENLKLDFFGVRREGDHADVATCIDCGKRFSWYCPTSPDLTCKYHGPHKQDWTRQEGKMNGRSYTDYDDCIYCGGPEERK